MKNRSSKESGFTLVLGLVFILVASMSAVTLMRGSVMQEQMTANMNQKAISFMAAEAGASEVREKLSEGWPAVAKRNSWLTDSKLPTSNAGSIKANFGKVGYYWIKPNSMIWDSANNTVSFEVVGHVVQGPDIMGGTSIYVKFAQGGFGFPAALTIAGSVKSFEGGNSNNFAISGDGSPAIATQNKESLKVVTDGIPSNRKDNYSGNCSAPCVKEMDLGSPWNDAGKLIAEVERLKGNSKVAFHEGDWINKSLDNDKPITIVMGDMEIKGNQADYNGVIIVLGGSFVIKGGGNTTIDGAVYVAGLVKQQDGSWKFGESMVDISGGGKMEINHVSTMGSSMFYPKIEAWREVL